MKTIRISNGEVRIGYEFGDLSEEAKHDALCEQVRSEIEIMTPESPYFEAVVQTNKMHTPWFLFETIYHDYKKDLVESIDINDYLFNEDGEMLPIIYHTKKGKIVRITYGKKEYDCEISGENKINLSIQDKKNILELFHEQFIEFIDDPASDETHFILIADIVDDVFDRYSKHEEYLGFGRKK